MIVSIRRQKIFTGCLLNILKASAQFQKPPPTTQGWAQLGDFRFAGFVYSIHYISDRSR
jgi:hypothetical protein